MEWHKLELPRTLQHLFVGPSSPFASRVSLWDLVLHAESDRKWARNLWVWPYCSRLLSKGCDWKCSHEPIFSCDFHFLGTSSEHVAARGPSSSPWGISARSHVHLRVVAYNQWGPGESSQPIKVATQPEREYAMARAKLEVLIFVGDIFESLHSSLLKWQNRRFLEQHIYPEGF